MGNFEVYLSDFQPGTVCLGGSGATTGSSSNYIVAVGKVVDHSGLTMKSGAGTCNIALDGMEAYYAFNGDASDSSFPGRNGAWTGTEAYGAGVSGADGDQAASFDGASFIDVDAFKSFDWGAQFSMSVWFKRVGCDGNYQGIIGNGYYAHGSWEVRMGREDASCANADVWECGDCAVGCTCSMLGGGVVTALHDTAWDHLSINAPIDQWHNVLMIYEGAPQNNLACVPWDTADRVMQLASDDIPNQDLCTAVTDTYTWDPWCATSTEGDVPGAVYDDWAYCTAPGLHFYMDGSLQVGNLNNVGVMGTSNDQGPLVVTENALRIGKAGSTTLTTSAGDPIDEFFTGLIDNVRIYTSKLSHHDAHAIFTCEGGAEVTCDTDATIGSTSAGATAATGSDCVFPFTYMGEEFNHCTDAGVPGYPEDIHTRLWCATEAVCDSTPCGGAEDVANGGCVNTCQWANCINCYSSFATRPDVITNIVTSSTECTPVASRLTLNSPYYCDRDYVFTDIPAFLGGTAIITTANNDKQADASDTDFLCFDIAEPSTVYILYDIRIPEPAWLLSMFTDIHVRYCCSFLHHPCIASSHCTWIVCS